MRDSGRIAAAIQILEAIEARPRPVSLALKDWGRDARFAGAKDRAFVSGLVLDTLRKRRSSAWRLGSESVRAAVLGVLRFSWDWPAERIVEAAAGEHGPGALTNEEVARLALPKDILTAPAPVRGDYPDWLDKPLARAFGDERAAQMELMAERAPVDLRVNTLKCETGKALAALEALEAHTAGLLPETIRIAAPQPAERAAPVEAHPAYLKGWVEVQDAGSQVAAAVAGDVEGLQVLDFCAGGGGKTLALAAAMKSRGQIYAFDADARRMVDIIPRAERAGVTNLDMRSPMDRKPLDDLIGRMDLVFVDAPCSGSGTWRRQPDAKWRLKSTLLDRRREEQGVVMEDAARFVKPGGRMVYVTCSVLMEENEDQVAAFVARNPDFHIKPIDRFEAYGTKEGFVRLSPLSAGTDGFFAALLERTGDSG